MSSLVITAGTASTDTFPMTLAAPIVESKNLWTDDWEYDPELQVLSFSLHASSSSPDTAHLRRPYGNVKQPWDSDLSPRNRQELTGTWVRISLLGDNGPVVQFVGQIQDQATALDGVAAADGTTSGMEQWVAVGGLNLLRKQVIYQSLFEGDVDAVQRVDWIPDMNARDKRGFLVGNRSSARNGETDTYLYGGDDTWTHLDYLRYLVGNFIQRPDGPTWSVGGQIDILDGMKTTIKFAAGGTALQMVRELIPPKYGVDFRVKPVADATNSTFTAGYEISVFALVAEDQSVAGVSMPKNPNTVFVDRTAKSNLIDVQLVESAERKVDTIRIVGKRIVVCGSLSVAAGTLVPKWSAALETEYIAAASSSETDPEQLDRVRARDRYRMVYQQYGAPTDWDLGGGAWSVQCDLNGNPVSPAPSTAPAGTTTPAQFQTSIRETLPWIPLKEGFDYSVEPPTDTNVDGHTPDMKAPLAWVIDSLPDFQDTPRFIQADTDGGMTVAAPHQDWGIFVNATPNHKMALKKWTDAQIATTEHEPRFNYDSLFATIAIESDHRLQVGYGVPAKDAAGDGSTMVIVDEAAELWVMLPGTLICPSVDGYTFVFSGSALRVLRNDADRLKLALAGEVARYANERNRAIFRFKGLLAWGDMLGSILTHVQHGDDKIQVQAPITSIEWTCEKSPETLVKVGGA